MEGSLKREIVDWTRTIAWSLLLFFGLRVAVVEAYHVPTGSMLPTIQPGDRILGSKFHYRFWNPARGDVVVFRSPERARAMGSGDSKRLVKRVVAVAGDTVEVQNGWLLVDGLPMEEPYVREQPGYRMLPIVVPEDHVFVLGDNRNDSLDGHVWGSLEEDALLARAWVRYWPPWRIGKL